MNRTDHKIALTLLLALSVFWGCASAERKNATTIGYDDQLSPASPATRQEKRRAMSELASGVSDSGSEQPSEEVPGDTDANAGENDVTPVSRMMVYTGQMEIRSISPTESSKRAGAIVVKLGGHVEKSDFYESGRRIIVILRVPAGRFFEALDQLSTLGTVLSRSISAEDVTREFTDVEARLHSAKLLKERLERLLESVKNVDEKVKILREISRLATEIETLTARSKYLADRASLSTITLQLSAEPLASDGPDRRSPFPWVRNLNPAGRSLTASSAIEGKRPPAFFDNTRKFRSGAPALFFSPTGTVLRTGSVLNRPTGDAGFWRRALGAEFKWRLFKEVKSVPLKNGQLWVFQIHDGMNLFYYGISFSVTGKELQVFEAYSSSEASYKQDAEPMEVFLRSVEGGAR